MLAKRIIILDKPAVENLEAEERIRNAAIPGKDIADTTPKDKQSNTMIEDQYLSVAMRPQIQTQPLWRRLTPFSFLYFF